MNILIKLSVYIVYFNKSCSLTSYSPLAVALIGDGMGNLTY